MLKPISSNVDLCDCGKCKRVRMGEGLHKKHIFTNEYLKKLDKIQSGVTIVAILLVGFIVLIHFPEGINLEDKDKWTITIITLFGMASFLVGATNLTKKDQQLQTSSLFKVFELLSSPDMRHSRKNIYDKFHSFKKEEKKFLAIQN